MFIVSVHVCSPTLEIDGAVLAFTDRGSRVTDEGHVLPSQTDGHLPVLEVRDDDVNVPFHTIRLDFLDDHERIVPAGTLLGKTGDLNDAAGLDAWIPQCVASPLMLQSMQSHCIC